MIFNHTTPVKYLLLFLLLVSLIACGRIQQNSATSDDITIEMAVEPSQPNVGPAQLVISLFDANGQPVDNAALAIEGNMTHAGMVPVLAEASESEAGRYTVPFEWTMGGDWIVTVEATLPDGRQVSQEFPVTVQ